MHKNTSCIPVNCEAMPPLHFCAQSFTMPNRFTITWYGNNALLINSIKLSTNSPVHEWEAVMPHFIRQDEELCPISLNDCFTRLYTRTYGLHWEKFVVPLFLMQYLLYVYHTLGLQPGGSVGINRLLNLAVTAANIVEAMYDSCI